MIKGIMPTEKGMYIIDALEKTVPDMLSVDMTSDMEMELDKIARGKSDGNDFLNNYKKLVAKWVELIKNSDTSAMAGNTLICPLCSKPLIKKKVGWCCTGYSKDNPDSCRFYIANEICGKKISDVIAKRNTKNPKKLSTGHPICEAGLAMHKDGKFSDNGRTRQKYCCPFKRSKSGCCPCNHKNWNNGKKTRGCTKYVTLPDDY